MAISANAAAVWSGVTKTEPFRGGLFAIDGRGEPTGGAAIFEATISSLTSEMAQSRTNCETRLNV